MRIKINRGSLILSIILFASITIFLFVMYIKNSTKQVSLPTEQIKNNQEANKEDGLGSKAEYDELKNITARSGVKAAWAYLIKTYGQSNTKEEAHNLAHYVGKLIFEKDGLMGMTICTQEFAFGCYHGLLDQAFRKDLSTLPQAEKACEKVGGVGSGPYASCIHGIGHGVASYFKDKDLAASLKACDKLHEGAPQFCYDGVFMELSREALDSFYKPSDPLYPCNSIEPKYTYTCGRNQPTVLMSRLHLSYLDAAKACQRSTSRDLKVACFTSLGFQAVYSSDNNPKKIISTCESLNDREFEYQCKSAAAGELIFQDMTNWQTNAPAICNSLSGENQTNCHTYITNIQKDYHRS